MKSLTKALTNYIKSVPSFGQFTQALVSLYWVYCWKIIQQHMLVADNFQLKIRYTYTHFFHILLKVVLVSCNQIVWIKKNVYIFHMFFKSLNCLNAKQSTFGMRNIQYSIELSVHKVCVHQVYSIQQYNLVWIAQICIALFITLIRFICMYVCRCKAGSP